MCTFPVIKQTIIIRFVPVIPIMKITSQEEKTKTNESLDLKMYNSTLIIIASNSTLIIIATRLLLDLFLSIPGVTPVSELKDRGCASLGDSFGEIVFKRYLVLVLFLKLF